MDARHGQCLWHRYGHEREMKHYQHITEGSETSDEAYPKKDV